MVGGVEGGLEGLFPKDLSSPFSNKFRRPCMCTQFIVASFRFLLYQLSSLLEIKVCLQFHVRNIFVLRIRRIISEEHEQETMQLYFSEGTLRDIRLHTNELSKKMGWVISISKTVISN